MGRRAPHRPGGQLGKAEQGRQPRRLLRIVVSDGAASHRDSATWPRRRLVAARRGETRRAMRRAGVAAGAIRFLGLPDGALPETAGCAALLRRAVARTRGLALLVGPDAADDHPDHRAVARALARAPAGRARRQAYRVWGDAPFRPGRGGRVILPAAATKRSAIRCHRSQCGAITDDPAGFAISTRELARFSHPVECFVPVRR